MTLYALLGLAVAMLVLAASPGPGVFITMASAVASGFRSALAVIAGIVLGDVIFLLLAIFGLSLVAHTLGRLFTLVKLCGGIYLIWLGARIWTSAPLDSPNTPLSNSPHAASGFIRGLLVTLSNPKVILFYCGFLPTFFVDLALLSALDIALVVTLICAVLASVLTVYAYLACRASRVFASRVATRRINRAAGGVMLATGATMLAWLKR